MDIKIDALLQSIRPLVDQAREQNAGILTEQMIRNQVEQFESFPPFAATYQQFGTDKIVQKLLEVYTTWIGEARILEDKKHKAWLPDKRSGLNWSYWNRYEEYLRKKAWPDSVTKELDKSTDQILGLLEDPARNEDKDPWDRRGMVVGHVQSGKTANYTGLICKAIDAGYKVIVVLAGLHNSLRTQTQIRLDEGVLGYDSTRSFDSGPRSPIGVGLSTVKPAFMVDSVTNRQDNGDFRKSIADRFNIHLSSNRPPLLFVVKKNASVLRNLNDWLDDICDQRDIDGNNYISGVPLLVIDDEADHGSIDTKKMKLDSNGDPDPDHDPTTLNKNIRRLLKYFSQSAYVGYTATPFANIFIHHEMTANRRYGEDLFPRSFIVNLAAPSNYFGPVKVFGLQEDENIGQKKIEGLPVVRTKDVEMDAYSWLEFKHDKNTLPNYCGERKVPPSLQKAIWSFVLAVAARRERKQLNQHNSMLVHVTRLNDVQDEVHNQVYNELEYLKDHIKRDTGIYKTELREKLKRLWENDFKATTKVINDVECPVMEWKEIESQLVHTVQSIAVKTINGSTGDILDYENSKDIGLNVIAIGGDKLSRGLTLEGLSVSYFTRSSSSPMYDTLMQMGRWFGYRSGYYDLCRLYTTDDIAEWFSYIASASEELRREFDHMIAIGATPEEYGAKVRSHPTLLVTSKVKMRHGSSVMISFSNHLAETRLLPFDERIVDNNYDAACALRKTVAYEGKKTSNSNIFLLDNSAAVVEFLQHYIESAKDFVDTEKLAEYIGKQNEKNYLTRWTVYFPSGRGEEYIFCDSRVKLNQRQWGRGLYDADKLELMKQERLQANALVLNHLISEDHEFVDIEKEKVEKVKKKHAEEKRKGSKASLASFVRQERSPQEGLLIVYLLDHIHIADRTPSKPLVGFALSFPQIGNDTKVEYIVNSVFLEQDL